MISLKEALALIETLNIPFNTCLMPLHDSIGNFYANDILSSRDFPPFNRSAVDGYAFYVDNLPNHSLTLKKVDTLFAGGTTTNLELQSNECIKIMTGAAVPTFCNVVVRVEDTIKINEQTVQIKAQAISKKYQNIALQGEDCKQDQLVFKKGKRIQALHLPTLAAMGLTHLPCFQNLHIPIINTGNEIVTPGTTLPSNHSIYESNSTAIKSLLQNYPITFSSQIISDDWEALSLAIQKNSNAPILLFTGGVSAGDADYVPKVLEANGYDCLFHKIAIKPGKPVWVGVNKNKHVAIGLPGNPISVMVNVKLIIETIIRKALQAIDKHYLTVESIQWEVTKPNKTLDVLQLYVLNNYKIEYSTTNGSGDILNTSQSTGFVVVPAGSTQLTHATIYPWFSEV